MCTHKHTQAHTSTNTHKRTKAHPSCGAPPRPQELSSELYSVKKLTDVEHVCYLLRIDSPEGNEDGPSPIPTAHADSNSQGGVRPSPHQVASMSGQAGAQGLGRAANRARL